MGKKVKIVMPYILDDPIVGRTIVPTILRLRIKPFADFLTIDDDKLTYKKQTFSLKTIDKLLLVETEVTPWTSDHMPDYSEGLIGTAITLYLVDNSGEKHVLIPRFLMNVHNWGQKGWNRFLDELSAHSGLPIEKTYEPSQYWKDNN